MERTDSSASSCRGMTLIELLLVMAILSVVMLAITSLFIPMQRSTVVQTQVTDVQANLRLAVNVLSQDLVTAGFLVADAPIFFESATPSDPDPEDDFTIRTRLVGNRFGRVLSAADSAGNVVVTLSNPEMVAHFPVNSRVRLFDPVGMRECGAAYDENNASLAAARVYTVEATSANTLTIDTGSVVAASQVLDETVVVAVNDTGQPTQTIRYRFADTDGDGNGDALLRIVNGTTQFLAREVSDVVFSYDYTPGGKVQRIDITLTGQTQALVANDAIAGAKTRALRTSVNLRNVF